MASTKAPKRGCTICSECGESNGNRALKCKSCGIWMQGKTSKRPKLSSLSQEVTVCNTASEGNVRTFSCRVRREGPDYRTFVTEDAGTWKCYYKGCLAAQHVRERSSGDHICKHISTVKMEHISCTLSPHMDLCTATLEKLAVPLRDREDMLKLLSDNPCLVQQVSENTFVVRDSCESQQHPLGLLHVRLSKQQLFFCPCSDHQRSTSGSAITAKPTRRCIHFYLCFWAITCNPQVAAEFPSLITSPAGKRFTWVCVCMCM